MDSHAKLCLYQMMQFISQILGPTYHFAFYDAEDLPTFRPTFSMGEEPVQNSISRTALVRQIVLEGADPRESYQLGLKTQDAPGCSHNVFFLRKDDNTLAGLLVISDNCEGKLKLLSEIEAMLNIKSADHRPPAAPADSGLAAVSLSSLQHLVQELLDEMDIEAKENLMPIQKMKIVGELRRRGAFKIKGAVPLVAQLLNTSIPTIYRYLNKLDPLDGMDDEIHRESIRLL